MAAARIKNWASGYKQPGPAVSGSGTLTAVVGDQGLVVTAAHLFEGKVGPITVEFKDGTKLKEVVCEYPIGHKRRRKEGMPVLVEKFKRNLARRYSEKQQRSILDLCMDADRLAGTPVNEFVDHFVI